MTSERRSVVMFVKQSLLCFREMDLHAYFTQPVIQVGTVQLHVYPLHTYMLSDNNTIIV